MKAYQTNEGAVLLSAITAVDVQNNTVLIYVGSKPHVFYQAPDAATKYQNLINDMGVTIETSSSF